MLPRGYGGERHRVRIEEASKGSGGVANYEERLGPGPGIESDANVLTVMFVSSQTEPLEVSRST